MNSCNNFDTWPYFQKSKTKKPKTLCFPGPSRVANFRQNNYSAEDGIDGTNG